MNFRLVDNQKEWDEFISGQKFSQFLQSWSWGEFQKAYGRRVWRVGFFDNDQMVGAAQIVEHYLGLGMGYLYSPRGPIFESGIRNQESGIRNLFDFIRREIVNYGHIFLRTEPLETKYLILNTKYFRIPSIQPACVLLLDLSKSEEELLAGMHPKTRYNIRLAEKKGLEFGMMNDELRNGAADDSPRQEGFHQFWQLMLETAKRDKIRLHPRRYYELMLQFVPCSLFFVFCQSQPLAAGVFIGFGNTFAYVHGASANQHREMMASHLLHWRAMQFAKKNGYHYYDFGGVNPEDENDFDYRPSWEGLTRFKKSFGGQIISYVGTYEIPFNLRWYRIYRFVKRIRRLILPL